MDNDDNDLLLHNIASQHQLELDDEGEFLSRVRLLAAVLIVGSNEDHAWSVKNRRPHRQYLGRTNLLPNPRIGTPWIHLYENHEDRAFITTMGIDTSTFNTILEAGFGRLWYIQPIPRPDKRTDIYPRAERRSLDAAGGLSLVLHWLSLTMRHVSLQQIFALVPSTVSRYIHFALSILLEVLRQMPPAAISWPQGDEFLELSGYVSMRHSLLQGVFGSIDGLNLPCQVLSDIEIENAMYNGWLHSHFISSVIVFSSKGLGSPKCASHWMLIILEIGEIIGCRTNCPGSWHDSRVAEGIYGKLEHETPDGYCIVANSAFPAGHDRIAGKILVPLKANEKLPEDSAQQKYMLQLLWSILSYHQTAEWGMRELQGSFGRLRIPLEIEDMERRADLIESCFRLHNLRTRLVGINQIRNVYVPVWREGDSNRIWEGFEGILFSDQRKHDHVWTFHVQEEWY